MKVIIVDDDHIFRMLLREMLSTNGYQVIEAKNGKEGWEKIKSEKPDIAIFDVSMPEMDGIELLNKVREDDEFFDLPIMMLTVKDSIEDQVKGFEHGADDYLAKPFDEEILLAKIKALERRIIKPKKTET
jgi:DNA-binding response OmpR family regulator